MLSNKFPRLADLIKNLKKLLKKYDAVSDIIIFGSFVKGREHPKDVDIAIIVQEKDPELAHSIKNDLGIKEAHLELIRSSDLYSSTLFLSIINEGYSVKHQNYLRDMLNLKPMRLYVYDLKHLDKSKKTLFDLALRRNLPRIKSEKIGKGAVLVPLEYTSYFEDFLEVWGLKYKTKEWTVF